MTPERWADVKALFAEALTHGEGGAREAFLTGRCGGDTQLLDAVCTLLRSHEAAGDFIEASPVSGLVSDVASVGRFSGEMRGNYRLGRRVAAGGMGEVYESRDTRSGARVAIKVLTDDGLDAARRLKREGHHALEVNHPNICRVHEVAEDDAGAFIAMEFLDGRVLSDAVPPQGFEQATVLSLALQLAEAVAHAHERGLVHRDLKCANLMLLPDGALKVLDFGLARRLSPGVDSEVTAATLTEAGAVAGTLSYLAPEVLRGDRADRRSDVWAFGVVLHELLTGSRPFEGRTSFELTSRILREPPPGLPSSIPAGLRAIRDNCLEKNPDDRYDDGGQILSALRMLQSGGRVPRRRSRYMGRFGVIAAGAAIVAAAAMAWMAGTRSSGTSIQRPPTSVAVLPFVETGVSPDQRYFADGLTQGVIDRLGTIDALRVISRTTMMRYEQGTSVADLRRELQADVAIRGTIDRSAHRVRLAAQLVDAATGRELWRETFDRPANEVLAVEADAARAIVARLGVPVSAGADAASRRVRAVDPAVYELFLKGRFQWNRRTAESLSQAVQYYKAAIERDPTYAPAHAALADCYNQFGTFLVGTASPATMRPLARAAAIAAIQNDESLAEAHASLGYISHYDWDWATADREFRRALELNPNLALARVWYANSLMSRGRMDEALAEVRRAEALDPFSRAVITNVGWVLSYARRSDEAIAAFRRALALDPDYIQARIRLGDEFMYSGRFEEAIAEHRAVAALMKRSPSSISQLAGTLAAAGQRTEARALLDELHALSEKQYVSPVGFYTTYFQLGDRDTGFAWLERGVAERSNGVVYIAVDPGHNDIRGDARYHRVLERIGLADVK